MASEVLAATLLPLRPQRSAVSTRPADSERSSNFGGYIKKARAGRKSARAEAAPPAAEPAAKSQNPTKPEVNEPKTDPATTRKAGVDAVQSQIVEEVREAITAVPAEGQTAIATIAQPAFADTTETPSVKGARPFPPRVPEETAPAVEHDVQKGRLIEKPILPEGFLRPGEATPLNVQEEIGADDASADTLDAGSAKTNVKLNGSTGESAPAAASLSAETEGGEFVESPAIRRSILQSRGPDSSTASQADPSRATKNSETRDAVAPSAEPIVAKPSEDRATAPKQEAATPVEEIRAAALQKKPVDPRAADGTPANQDSIGQEGATRPSSQNTATITVGTTEAGARQTESGRSEDAAAILGKYLAVAIKDADGENPNSSTSQFLNSRTTGGSAPSAHGDAQGVAAASRPSSSFVSQLLTARADVANGVDLAGSDAVADAARALASDRANGRQQVTLQLDPPELGRLRLDVSMRHDAMSLRVGADSPAVARLIQSRMDKLEDALATHGIRIERSEIIVRGAAGSDPTGANKGDDPNRSNSQNAHASRHDGWPEGDRGDGNGFERHHAFDRHDPHGFEGRWERPEFSDLGDPGMIPMGDETDARGSESLVLDGNATSPTSEFRLDLVA